MHVVLCAVSKVRRLPFLSFPSLVWKGQLSALGSPALELWQKFTVLLWGTDTSVPLPVPARAGMCLLWEPDQGTTSDKTPCEKWKLLFSWVCFAPQLSAQSQGCLSWQNGVEHQHIPGSKQESRTKACVGSMLAAGINKLEITPSEVRESSILSSHRQHVVWQEN